MAAILIVEDDVAFATMLKTFFEKRDYKVETAFTATDSFKKLTTQSFESGGILSGYPQASKAALI